MGIEWSEVGGIVELLGDAQAHQHGRIYSVVKLRGDDGQLVSFNRVQALTQVNAALHVGHRVRLLLFKAKGQHQAVAALTEDERVDDVELLAQAGRYLRIMRLGSVALAAFPFVAWAVEPYGSSIAALVAWPMAVLIWLAYGRRATLVPSRDELQRRVDAFHAG